MLDFQYSEQGQGTLVTIFALSLNTTGPVSK